MRGVTMSFLSYIPLLSTPLDFAGTAVAKVIVVRCGSAVGPGWHRTTQLAMALATSLWGSELDTLGVGSYDMNSMTTLKVPTHDLFISGEMRLLSLLQTCRDWAPIELSRKRSIDYSQLSSLVYEPITTTTQGLYRFITS